tara:strand:+ start:220 stop:555 length:336 start_codon:yes stop_codon:yes gene_type:complete
MQATLAEEAQKTCLNNQSERCLVVSGVNTFCPVNSCQTHDIDSCEFHEVPFTAAEDLEHALIKQGLCLTKEKGCGYCTDDPRVCLDCGDYTESNWYYRPWKGAKSAKPLDS